MKTFLIFISALCLHFAAHTQTLKQAEYFIDKDKGPGKNNKLNLVASADSSYQFTVDLSAVGIGMHKLYIRLKDNKNKWSETTRENIEVIASSASPVITSGEYFFDNDPGYGKADKITIVDKDTVAMQNFAAAVSNLKAGFHKLYVRAKDNNNNWSITIRKNAEVLKTEVPVKIIAAEYFFDTDKGMGKATTKDLTTSSADSTFKFKIAYNKIPSDADTLFIRAEDSLGRWSLTKIALFNVQSLVSKAITSNMQSIENGKLTVFPNPANDILNYDLNSANKNITIVILNLDGKTVKKYQFITAGNGQVNISDLAAGVYLLQADDGAKKQSVKFIKQ